MDQTTRAFERLACWGAALTALAYALAHLLLVAALVTFGRVAGGYPLAWPAIALYGAAALVGSGLALFTAGRSRGPAERLQPLLALAVFLAVALAGAFFATPILGGFGLRAEYAPYLDDEGAFALLSVWLAVAVFVVALLARWRRLLILGMLAQGLALVANPGLLAAAVRYGLPPAAYGLLAVPALYLCALLALGWRPRWAHLAWLAGLLAGGLALSAGLLLAAYPELRRALAGSAGYWGALLPWHILATGAFFPTVLGLPAFAWRLRGWAAGEAPPRGSEGEASPRGSEGEAPPRGSGGEAPPRGSGGEAPPRPYHRVVGAGLALLAGVWAGSWPYLGPTRGLGDGWLPEAGSTLGWIGKTVPPGVYGAAGVALGALKAAFPWLLAAAALAWVAAALLRAVRRGLMGTVRALGFAGGLAVTGLAILWQSPLLPPFAYLPWRELRVHGLAGAVAMAIGEDWLGIWLYLAYALLGLALVGLSAPLRDGQREPRRRLAFSATLVALVAAALLTVGLWAGVALSLRTLDSLAVPEYREQVVLGLALSLPLNVALAIASWATVAAGLRALTAGPAALPRPVMARGLALAGALAIAGGVAFWQLTALPIAETSPAHGAIDVPTNAPIVVRLRPGPRNWGSGIIATYADTGQYVPGTSGGSGAGEAYFSPAGGWRPNARVEVRIMGGTGLRTYTFSFTTAAGPSASVAPLPGPTPAPTPTNPVPQP